MPAGFAATKSLAKAAVPPASQKPNFRFMIAADLTYRSIQAINSPEIRTLNLEGLTASGSAFTRCFHQESDMFLTFLLEEATWIVASFLHFYLLAWRQEAR
jgi:hypothetical protein